MEVDMSVEIVECECVEAGRGVKCGKRWFQATVEGQTIGACGVYDMRKAAVVPFTKKDLPLTVHVDREGKQTTIVMRTASGETAAATALTSKASGR